MIDEKIFNKKTIKAYIAIISTVVILLTVGLIMLKYSVEGEKNLPFEIKELNIISTARGQQSKDDEGLWYTDLSQKNDIYFYINKNDRYKKQERIEKIIFTNFQINKNNDKGLVAIYRPYDRDAYEYTEEYIIKDTLEYVGATNTDVKKLQMNNQGGLIGFSVLNSNLGKYYLSQNETFAVDGTLLNKADITLEDITLKISFDIIIETGSGNKFKANHMLDLPSGNILEEGIANTEIEDLSKIVFKRF